jgi:hypothetical protein
MGGPLVGFSTRSPGTAILMSRTAFRSDNTDVWQYCPSQSPPSSPQNDCAEADAVGALTTAAATIAAPAETRIIRMTETP